MDDFHSPKKKKGAQQSEGSSRRGKFVGLQTWCARVKEIGDKIDLNRRSHC